MRNYILHGWIINEKDCCKLLNYAKFYKNPKNKYGFLVILNPPPLPPGVCLKNFLKRLSFYVPVPTVNYCTVRVYLLFVQLNMHFTMLVDEECSSIGELKSCINGIDLCTWSTVNILYSIY